MKTILIREPGGPDVLSLEDMPAPEPKADEVLIEVAAAGVNRPDVLQRQGLYPPPPGASNIPGLEVSGKIAAVGASVTRWKVGDTVAALTSGGGYAEYAVAQEGSCLRVPKGLSMAEAACLPETFMTVWHNVFERGALKAGECFLVHGGSSGIGSTAIQLATHFGARVFATAGSDEKCAYCESLGAEAAINYRTNNFAEEIKTLTCGKGVNVILDMVGGSYIQNDIRCAAEDGRIVQIAFLKGAKVEVNLMPIMLKRLTLTGSTLRPRSAAFKAQLARTLEEKVWPLIESGAVRVVIDKTFPLAEAAEAHRHMETNAHMGKIVLTV
ncbi:NAD(P)H-quinone oxidoreductase [Rhodomicrobium udaipurense JA643]|uniref:NAD(P)H-quinone oxidoreductase n=1 Tax=Rhodomicrobium udaipurense TaxID=1202716 RepID=A0A8I1KJQ8_9HYPH|nr:NAD(P)H-quinone oxidoreductase [Rhodomicrobium udaipurense]KAI93553.1 NAD(P)H-quinone oxidoreductase [Rhodomicrobium udaipurense JA643]MBJ7543221.1 NAD(P)H-quinone oxidoreductase [Rhodomicrobium udaipurense]